MHYIVGTEIVKSGKQLSLYNISRKDDKILYTFIDSNGDRIEFPFENTIQADRYIANARGEDLPRYHRSHQSGA